MKVLEQLNKAGLFPSVTAYTEAIAQYTSLVISGSHDNCMFEQVAKLLPFRSRFRATYKDYLCKLAWFQEALNTGRIALDPLGETVVCNVNDGSINGKSWFIGFKAPNKAVEYGYTENCYSLLLHKGKSPSWCLKWVLQDDSNYLHCTWNEEGLLKVRIHSGYKLGTLRKKRWQLMKQANIESVRKHVRQQWNWKGFPLPPIRFKLKTVLIVDDLSREYYRWSI